MTIEEIEKTLQMQQQSNLRYEILIRAIVDVLGAGKLDEISKRAEEIKADAIKELSAKKASVVGSEAA